MTAKILTLTPRASATRPVSTAYTPAHLQDVEESQPNLLRTILVMAIGWLVCIGLAFYTAGWIEATSFYWAIAGFTVLYAILFAGLGLCLFILFERGPRPTPPGY